MHGQDMWPNPMPPPTSQPWHLAPPLYCSPGAAYDPSEVVPAKKDHVLPVAPRVPLHPEGAVGWMLCEVPNVAASQCCSQFVCILHLLGLHVAFHTVLHAMLLDSNGQAPP